MKQGKKSLNHDAPNLLDSIDLKNQANQINHKNQGLDNMQGWEIKKLGEVVDIINGRNQSAVISDNGQYPIYGSAGNLMGLATDYLCEEGTTIIGRKGNISNPIYIEEKFWNVDTAFGLYPKNGYSTKFINYLCQTIDFKSRNRGTTIPSLVKSDLLTIDIPFVSSLPEQQRIVSILDETFAAIAKAKANAEQNLKNAKEIFESYLQGVFENGNENWETKCLDELGTITSSKRIYKSEYVKDGVPFYRTKEIKELSNGKSITLELFISRERYNEIKKSFGVPQINDLLMSAVGTIGEIMVIENNDEFYFKDGNIVWFKGFKSLETNYLKFALTAFVEKIKSLAIGAAYSALTIEKLNKYQISFPKTIKEQQTIVRQLDALRTETQKLEAVYQKKIADLEELKKAILQKAFAGELRGSELFESKTATAVV